MLECSLPGNYMIVFDLCEEMLQQNVAATARSMCKRTRIRENVGLMVQFNESLYFIKKSVYEHISVKNVI